MKTGGRIMLAILLSGIVLFLSLNKAYSATSWINNYVVDNSTDVPFEVVQTSDGGYIATGYKYSDPADGTDVVVARLDPVGNIIWQKMYSYANYDAKPSSIHETSDSGYVVAGNDWIMKLDSIGNIEWQKFVADAYYGYATQAVSAYQTPDGGFIFTGSQYRNGGSYARLVKLDSLGNVEWHKFYSNRNSYYGEGNTPLTFKMTRDSGYILAGTLSDSSSDHAYVVKLDKSGNIAWQKQFGSWGHDYATSVAEAADGSILVSGYSNYNYEGKPWVIKFDSNGNLAWKYLYGYTRNYTKIVALKEGGYVLGLDSGIIKLDQNGLAEWYSYFSSHGGVIKSLNPTIDGGIISSFVYGQYWRYSGEWEIRKANTVTGDISCGIDKRPVTASELPFEVKDAAVSVLPPTRTYFLDIPFTVSSSYMAVESVCKSATPEISLGPNSLDFGSAQIGASKTATVTVTNTGSDFLNLFGANVTGPGADAFAYTTDCSTVPSGGSCSIRVAYTPKIAGTVNATMSISSNDPVHPSIEVLLSGTGEPMAEAGPDQTVEQTSPAGAYVALDGSGSKLGCAETPNYQWTWSMGSAIGVNPVALLPAGNTTVTLQVTACGTSATDAVSITIRDTVRPVTASNLIGLPGLNGWFRSDVTVALSASDAGSGIREIRYSLDGATETAVLSQNTNVTIAAEGMHTLIYYAIDNAGNIEPPTAVTLKIDKTSPDIIIEGVQHGKTYELGLTPPSPSYTASDALSGVAAGSSSYLSGGSDTGLGEYTYTVTASDNAGNTVTKIAVYYVAATPGKLDALITQMEKTSPPLITGNTGEVLIDFLKDALKKYEGGNLDAADNKMENAFIHHILAQSGKTITLDAAAALIDAAKYIIEHN